MASRTGRFAVIEQFLADGIHYMFGNPGTVEQSFLDALGEYSEFKYIDTLQETVAVAIADGYARATREPTVVQLHSGVGLGNGIGMLYQAKRGHAPLVVVAGEAGVKYDSMDAQMAADLVAMARPVTKYATRVLHPESLLRVLRRAIKIAGTPPMGPVFVSLPEDVLDATIDEEIVPSPHLVTRTAPESHQVSAAASMLASANRPLIIVGDGVAASGAQGELTRVAELLGAPVWGADSSEVNMDSSHPQWQGSLGHMFGSHSQTITSQADVILICGTYVFPEVYPALSGVFASGARVIHIDLDAFEIAKNFPVDLGVVSDPKLTLARLAGVLETTISATQRVTAKERVAQLEADKRRQQELEFASDREMHDVQVPLYASRFMEELAKQIPEDAIIFDEGLTTSPEITRYIPSQIPGHYFQTRGGSLGVGIPGAMGLKLAHPDKTVIGFSGDGGSLYTIQALWTAARYDIGAKFIICNNGDYLLLKLNLMQYWSERGIEPHEFPASFELNDPPIQFDQLARGFGVPGVRIETPDQCGPAIRQALEHSGPFLIDMVVSNDAGRHFKHLPGHPRYTHARGQ